MKLDKDYKRLVIYFFFDKEGVVDRYIPYMLDDVVKNTNDLMVVCNGLLDDKGREIFSRYTDDVLVRENVGFDVWAYKESIEHIGWDKVCSYDEVVFMNYTIMGPVYPFKEMFDTMDARDLDFWGITEFFKTEDDPFGTMPEGYIPDHIQSHFIAVRRSLLGSQDFRTYWEEMPMITSYFDSIGNHESKFTKHFSDKGYTWQPYVDAEDLRVISHQPLIGVAKTMIRDKRCPIFKRRSFMQDYNVVLNESMGEQSYELYHYLKDHTDYDTDMLMENLIRVENNADLKKNFQWNYILPTNYSAYGEEIKNRKIALFMHIFFDDLINDCATYASRLPEHADIFITTTTEENKKRIEEAFSKIPQNVVYIRVTPNKGRDVGPFLVEFADYYEQYDYICHAHDKKAGQIKPGSVGMSFAYKCFENIFPSRAYVENVLHIFEEDKFAGMLVPPPPNHADYYITFGLEWGPNYKATYNLVKSLGLHANIRPDKEPIAGLGTFFWARKEVLRPIFAKRWTYDDFPDEPTAIDGTILHALERVYPFAAQSEGYYTGWIMADYVASMEVTNMNHMIRELNNIIFFKGLDAGSYHETRMKLSASYDVVNDVRAGKYLTPEQLTTKPRFAFLPGFIRRPLAKMWHKIRRK
ncbi:MAG: rhamnan synthesis F family protein [Lachnospiraceae bacterium]|nr:rhamnan synthesis F family protein [Lachnospiraceae bacterium]